MFAVAWLPSLDSNGDWAVGAGGAAARVLEASLGGYSPHVLEAWVDSEEFKSGTTSGQPHANPDVWTDGSLVRDDLTGVCCGVRCFCSHFWVGLVPTVMGAIGLLPPHAEFGVSVVVSLFLLWDPYSRCRELNFGRSFWLCKQLGLCIWWWIMLTLLVMLVESLLVKKPVRPFSDSA